MKRLLALAAGVSARSEQAVTTLSGRWLLVGRYASSPLSLALDGTRITGTLDGRPIEGDLVDKTVTFGEPDSFRAWREHTIGSADAKEFYQSVYIATLQADGALSGMSRMYMRGYLQSVCKVGYWTATRASTQ